ncbi:MAG: GFA family protein [Deltaproteobacteria bacterium]|nr:GFA family protein [Deltaproteobacteria bacterium]
MAISGSCLCAAVSYEIEGTLSDAGHCHCTMCRKGHGAAFASYASVDPDRFRWVSGSDAVARFESSAGEDRLFCRICGSTLGGMSRGRVTSITLGSVDDDPGVRPLSHIFVGSKASWHEITDDLPQFEEWPPGENWS